LGPQTNIPSRKHFISNISRTAALGTSTHRKFLDQNRSCASPTSAFNICNTAHRRLSHHRQLLSQAEEKRAAEQERWQKVPVVPSALLGDSDPSTGDVVQVKTKSKAPALCSGCQGLILNPNWGSAE